MVPRKRQMPCIRWVIAYLDAQTGWSVGWLVGRLVGCLLGCLVGLLIRYLPFLFFQGVGGFFSEDYTFTTGAVLAVHSRDSNQPACKCDHANTT